MGLEEGLSSGVLDRTQSACGDLAKAKRVAAKGFDDIEIVGESVFVMRPDDPPCWREATSEAKQRGLEQVVRQRRMKQRTEADKGLESKRAMLLERTQRNKSAEVVSDDSEREIGGESFSDILNEQAEVFAVFVELHDVAAFSRALTMPPRIVACDGIAALCESMNEVTCGALVISEAV